MRKSLFLLMSILLFQINGYAQNGTITGTVTEADTGMPLLGVNVPR